MSAFRLICRSLLHHARTHLAVAAGVAVAAAVLTGALLVGDSMRGSLRTMSLDRLGEIRAALAAPTMFRAALADELAAALHQQGSHAAVVPAILTSGSMETARGGAAARRANRVQVIGLDRLDRLFPDDDAARRRLGPRQIMLNAPLAEQLGVAAGDEVLLRLPRGETIPAESALGRKQDTLTSLRLTVAAVCAATGPGRFSLSPSQHTPRNAFVALGALQTALDEVDQANALLVARSDGELDGDDTAALRQALRPQLADCGLNLEHTPRGYDQVTTTQMILAPAVEAELLRASADIPPQPALTYLANTLACGEREIPYSTITALDFAAEPPLGPMLDAAGRPLPPLADGQIALNAWAAADLKAQPGDTIRVTYFEPESDGGQVHERTEAFTLAAVVALSGAAADRALTPTVRGVTDERSMADWDPPFPFDGRRIRKHDDQYWKDHGPTPKAFVSLATGRRLFASRFGRTTSLRYAPPDGRELRQEIESRLDAGAMGLVFQPVRQQALAAAAGTTPFSVLFLAFSFFIIAAAAMLVALLFQLGIERRAREVGLLAAVGLGRRRVAGLLTAEGIGVALVGSCLGVPAGVAYAALLLWGLRTWWLPAVGTPFLAMHWSWLSLAVGWAAGTLVGGSATAWAVWRTRRFSPRQLLAGQVEPPAAAGGYGGETLRAGGYKGKASYADPWMLAAAALVAAAVALGLWAMGRPEQERAAAFFGSGAIVLAAAVLAAARRLAKGGPAAAVAVGRGNLVRLALCSAARHPGRSALSIGLVATATFLVAAVGAFRMDAGRQPPALHSGNGGFALVAESDQPIYQALDTPAGREEAGLRPRNPVETALLAECRIFALRVRSGDDASCRNLYRPRQPRMLGLPPSLVARGGFAWSPPPDEGENPWQRLAAAAPADADSAAPLPVILEKNTATYSLNLWGGVGARFDVADARGQSVSLEIAALLADSIFQGDLLLDEQTLLQRFPEVRGYRLFLIECPAGQEQATAALLERELGDYGLAVQSAADRLAGFLVVQNTYLSTFQALGGLGLLLGTFGLAAVQLRNVLERRGELALLRAVGFRRRRLAALVLIEHAFLLCTGLTGGIAAAAIAVLPHQASRTPAAWSAVALALAATLAAGLLSGLIGVRAALASPLLPALRREL